MYSHVAMKNHIVSVMADENFICFPLNRLNIVQDLAGPDHVVLMFIFPS